MRKLIPLLLLPLALSGCVAAAVGAGTEAGVALAEERSVGGKIDDSVIYTDVSNRLIRGKNNLYMDVTVRVRHQRVMLTGIVATEDLAQRAVSAAWQAKGVKEVINELVIGNSKTMDLASDSLIKKNLEGRLFITKDVWVINYSIDVVNGTAYFLGRVYDRAELNRVMNVAKTTKGVKRVVSHLQVRSEMPVEISAPGTGAPENTIPAYRSAATPAPTSTYSPSTYSNPSDSGAYPPTDGTIGTDSVSSSEISAPAGGGY